MQPYAGVYNEREADLFNRATFEAWLESHGSRGIVGYIGDAFSNPIAQYVSDQGFSAVAIGGVSYQFSSFNGRETWRGKLPVWCVGFQRELATLSLTSWRTPVTASMAFDLLAQADEA